jgi:NADP-dependent 3-hydroxy acid dehydrogenase YdfG
MSRYTDKVVLITGAASGIGKASAAAAIEKYGKLNALCNIAGRVNSLGTGEMSPVVSVQAFYEFSAQV